MVLNSETRIVDITEDNEYDRYLHRCLTGPPSKGYKKRIAYLEKAILGGFHKKLLVFKERVVGTIEYAPPEISYYPIIGDNLTVMNCLWVLRQAKGHRFGTLLIHDMIENEKGKDGIATIALTDHWSPWFKREQIEKLGFSLVRTVNVTHNAKHSEIVFKIHLMWMPLTKEARKPIWNQEKLLEGITACIAHPLYHPQSYTPKQIFKEHLQQ